MRVGSVILGVIVSLACTLVQARTLTFVSGFNRPPYVIQHSLSGFELALINQVVQRMGYTAHFTFPPFGRSPRLFATTDVDAITTMNLHAAEPGMTLTDVYVTYENVVVTKQARGIMLSELEDLATVSLAAFHNAHVVLGDRFARAVADHPGYLELDNQHAQVSLFLQDRVEALVIDKHVLHYLLKQQGNTPAVTYHRLFPLSPYRVAFRDAELAAQFNRHLSDFRETPEYLALEQQYLGQ